MTSEEDDKKKRELIKIRRSTSMSVRTFPLLAELDGYDPGSLFWKWVVPGNESLFDSKSFAQTFQGLPTTIADTVDQALVDWLGGAPIPTVVEGIDGATSRVQEIVDGEEQTCDRMSYLNATTDPDYKESLSVASLLLESLRNLRNVVGDLSSRDVVLQVVGELRNSLYPQISKSNPNDRPLGRG